MTIHVTHAHKTAAVLANAKPSVSPSVAAHIPTHCRRKRRTTAESKRNRSTPRRLLRRVKVTAPHEMTAFARTSGDFNPIHTSHRGAAVSGLAAPLVHGMWLSATAQYAVQALDGKGAHYEIAGWTYNMYGMVQLDDEVEISVERVGRVAHSGMVLEVTSRIDGNIVSRGTAIVRAPKSAFVYPGQGIQQQGMVLDERAKSPAARDVWERADKVTCEKLGFSILAVVRDNPKELTANGVTYRHPEGLLNLTQFTQVALATVAFAQTARLREAGADIWPAYFAGHSLGEYNALSSFAGVIPLETVIELVFHRGSTMHHLIPRDEKGRSNYRMGALRPNQFGVGDDGVREYVESVSKASGEFLQIVNYNLAGQQYAVAGTIAGLKALKADSDRRVAEYGGKPAFMLVPGIDVPFHSTLLRKGVPEFRDKLDALLPQTIDYRGRLVGRYIPNLVAAPFEMTKEFAAKILEVVPSERIQGRFWMIRRFGIPMLLMIRSSVDCCLRNCCLGSSPPRCVGLRRRLCCSVPPSRAVLVWKSMLRLVSAMLRHSPILVPRRCVCHSLPVAMWRCTTLVAMMGPRIYDRFRFVGSGRRCRRFCSCGCGFFCGCCSGWCLSSCGGSCSRCGSSGCRSFRWRSVWCRRCGYSIQGIRCDRHIAGLLGQGSPDQIGESDTTDTLTNGVSSAVTSCLWTSAPNWAWLPWTVPPKRRSRR